MGQGASGVRLGLLGRRGKEGTHELGVRMDRSINGGGEGGFSCHHTSSDVLRWKSEVWLFRARVTRRTCPGSVGV